MVWATISADQNITYNQQKKKHRIIYLCEATMAVVKCSPEDIYSCHAENRILGCGFEVSEQLRYLVLQYTRVNERLLTRLRANFFILASYTLTPTL